MPVSLHPAFDPTRSQTSLTGNAHAVSTVSPTPVIFTGTDQNDVVDGSNEADQISGGGGADILHGWGGDDVIDGGDELGWHIFADSLFGDDGNDLLRGGAGNDRMHGGNGKDRLLGGDGNDELQGGPGDDTLEGGAGNDYLYDEGGANILLGGAGDDSLSLDPSTSGQLDGGEGDDYLAFWHGVIQGPITLTGGAGRDSFHVTFGYAVPGAAHPVITDFAAGADGDRLDLTQLLPMSPTRDNPFATGEARLFGFSSTWIQFKPAGSAGYVTILELKGVSPQQLVAANFIGYAPPSGSAGMTLRGTEDKDQIEGTERDDSLHGLGGNDVLRGQAGDDLLDGGDGDDILVDVEGSNRLLGGAGMDHLTGGDSGTSVLDGGAGDDTLMSGAGNNTVLGGAGNDLLWAGWSTHPGARTVVLDGGEGDDRIGFNPASQSDPATPVILRASGGAGADTFVLANLAPGLTVLDFGADDRIDVLGVMDGLGERNPFGQAGYLALRQEGGDTRLYVDRDGAAGNAHAMSLAMTLAGVAPASLTGRNFSGNFDPDGLDRGLLLTGTPASDVLNGGARDDTISGGGANDYIDGGAGNDRIDGGDEADAQRGSGDLINGGAGDDLIHGDGGGDRIDGGDGKDTIYGDTGHDELDGGMGDDRVEGGAGDDAITDGQGANLLAGGAGNDTIRSVGSGARGTEIDGGEGNDSIEAGAVVARVSGGAGDDRLVLRLAPGGDTTGGPILVDAGEGHDDILIVGDSRAVTVGGGAGRDHYHFEGMMPGMVTITDFAAGADGDVIDLYSLLPAATGNPLAPGGQLRLLQDGGDVLLQYAADAQAFATRVVFAQTALGAFATDNFSEGMRPDGMGGGMTLQGGSSRDELRGGRLDDVVHGGDGRDLLFGLAGNDTLHGDAGNDLVVGDEGNDLLLGGAGNDTLQGGAGNDRLVGGAGLDRAVATGPRSGYVVERTAEGFRISGGGVFGDEGSDTLEGVERIVFSDVSGLAFDIDGGAGQAYRLYRAAFDRTPDAGGLGFWIRAIDNGSALEDIAAGFTQSAEFRDLYGAAPGNAELVGHLYRNILHRAPEQAGFDYWVRALDDKLVTLPQVLAMFSESAENVDAVAALIADGIVYSPW